jgi:hypothetical protein
MDKAVLRHVVGKSTLTEGIAVPRLLEDWVDAPELGCKRDIILHYNGSRTIATLRRIANVRGNVQIKYEGAKCVDFRQWLAVMFVATSDGSTGEYIEIDRCGKDEYRVDAFPLSAQNPDRLVVSDWILHGVTKNEAERFLPVREIPAVVQGVTFDPLAGQNFYNHALAQSFALWNWTAEIKVIPELPLKSDFIKDGILVEVEFGNARTYYQDYIKFALAYNNRVTRFGLLLVPTEAFARSLCEVGRQRAMTKGRHSYSGMIHFEKVRREFTYMTGIFKMPFGVAGIGRNGNRS